MIHRTCFVALLLAACPWTGAATVTPSSYEMANGHGQANGGVFNYWDLNYTGSGSTTTDGAALSGGLGDLTDGVVTTQNWFAVENAAGSGPWVGWISSALPGAVAVRFHFAPGTSIDRIAVHADDSDGAGGVDLPSRVLIDWTGGSAAFDITDPTPGDPAPSWLEFDGLAIAGVSFVDLRFVYRDVWVFVDEVRFERALLAQPPAALLAALGVLLLGAARRRG